VDEEDVLALDARLEKDVALRCSGRDRARRAARAAELYERAYDRSGGYYSAVNAATLALVAGERGRARKRAEDALRLAEQAADGYYAAATSAEAYLLLGNLDDAEEALRRAAALADGDHGAVATTRRQLRLVCAELGLADDVVALLPAPEVVHFCGHRLTGGGGEATADLERRIAEAVATHPVAYAYGSLAAGADILWAEALLEHGAELHVVLPFGEEEFVEQSVGPAGGDWVERFHRCRARAASVRFATEDAYLGDDVLYGYASELAMGLALLRARHVDGAASQLAVWDGAVGASDEAGTAVDVATWRRRGLPATVVPISRPEATPHRRVPQGRRVVRSLLFADVKGFSRLHDAQLPRFYDHLLGTLAAALAPHEDVVEYRNTWGDGLYLVVADVTSAARLALSLQDAIDGLDLAALDLPQDLGLRVGAHLGPVYRIHDPVLGRPSFAGAHVSRTARIEPVTPEGCVYVTEPFAAALLLAEDEAFTCDYVGHMPAAKDFGRLRMYRLRPAGARRG
jgi:hypothetical protein